MRPLRNIWQPRGLAALSVAVLDDAGRLHALCATAEAALEKHPGARLIFRDDTRPAGNPSHHSSACSPPHAGYVIVAHPADGGSPVEYVIGWCWFFLVAEARAVAAAQGARVIRVDHAVRRRMPVDQAALREQTAAAAR